MIKFQFTSKKLKKQLYELEPSLIEQKGTITYFKLNKDKLTAEEQVKLNKILLENEGDYWIAF